VTKDIVVGLVCFLGSIALFFSLGMIDEARARTFPEVVIVIMCILSALLIIQSLTVKKIKKESAPFPWRRFLLLFGMIVVYFFIMETVGFYLSAFLFFLAVVFVLGRVESKPIRVVPKILQAAIFTAVLFVLFSVLLEVQTPRGWWF
jgi:hypothetical protein